MGNPIGRLPAGMDVAVAVGATVGGRWVGDRVGVALATLVAEAAGVCGVDVAVAGEDDGEEVGPGVRESPQAAKASAAASEPRMVRRGYFGAGRRRFMCAVSRVIAGLASARRSALAATFG